MTAPPARPSVPAAADPPASELPAPPNLRRIFNDLRGRLDAGHWWPADTDFEIIAGAVLTQNTAWTNVERALANLRAASLLDPATLVKADREEVATAIRPSGFFRTKTDYLLAATAWFLSHGRAAEELPTDQLRTQLLAIRGVGEETADDILLYVYHRPVFIYDAYARRLLEAEGLGVFKTYRQAKRALDPLVAESDFSAAELALFHGLIVEDGKRRRRAMPAKRPRPRRAVSAGASA